MSKKNWIMVKRGLSEDSKHRQAMGNRIWLYLHILDRVDWETGIVYDWRDEDEAADMRLNWRTLERQRQELAELGYIECKQNPRSQDIGVYNWSNPRNYSGGIINPKGTQIFVPNAHKGTHQGTHQGSNDLRTPSLESLDQASGSQVSADKPRSDSQHPAIQMYRLKAKTYPDKAQYETIIEAVGEQEADLDFWGQVVRAYCDLGWNKRNTGNMITYFKRHELPAISKNGGSSSSNEHPALVAMRLAREEVGKDGNG